MTRILVGLLAALLLATFGSVSSLAANPYGAHHQEPLCHSWIDENGDGVCDHWTGEGTCPYHHAYLDEDGDGICDHRTGEGACPARHGESAIHGCQGGHRHQNGHHRR